MKPETDTAPGLLGGRIDFELARSLEWRESGFAPLADGRQGQPISETETDPARATVRRASRVLARGGRSPGARGVAYLTLLLWLMAALAAVGGAKLASAVLGDPLTGPVNIVWFLFHALGVQTLLLLLTLLLALPVVPGLGRLRELLWDGLSLGGLVVRAGLALAVRRLRALAEPDEANWPALTQVVESLGAARALRPLVLAFSQFIWIAFNFAFIGSAAVTLSAQHHVFAWQSTLVPEAEPASSWLSLMTAPSAVWPGLPSEQQVRLSRYDPRSRSYLDGAPDDPQLTRLRQQWSTQLLAAVVGWGLVPRLLLFGAFLIGYWRLRPTLLPPASDAYVQAVWESLCPALATHAEKAASSAADVDAHAAALKSSRSPPDSWFLLPYLSAAASGSLLPAFWGRGARGWSELERLDNRQAETRVVERLRATPGAVGLVIVCDYRLTPDAAIGKSFRRLVEALGEAGRALVVLAGGDAFRHTRQGRTPEGVGRRRALWSEALRRWGLDLDLVDFDPATATPAARQQLAARLGLEPLELSSVGPEAAFREALEGISAHASGWLAELDAAEAPRREALSLRQAAQARRFVDDCFSASEAQVESGARSGPLGKVLSRALKLPAELEPTALASAVASLDRMGSLLARARRLDPRFVVAGLTAGLVAGPLGGALAAGTAGLVSGASLASTLGMLGAALGGAVSLRWPGKRRAEDGAGLSEAALDSTADRLGLAARTGLMRALVLAHQGCDEPQIAERLERLAELPEARRQLDSAEAVAELVAAAASLGPDS